MRKNNEHALLNNYTDILIIILFLLVGSCEYVKGQVDLTKSEKVNIVQMFVLSGDIEEENTSQLIDNFHDSVSFRLLGEIKVCLDDYKMFAVRLNTSHSIEHIYIQSGKQHYNQPLNPEFNLLEPLLNIYGFYRHNKCEVSKNKILQILDSVYLENTVRRSKTTILPLNKKK